MTAKVVCPILKVNNSRLRFLEFPVDQLKSRVKKG